MAEREDPEEVRKQKDKELDEARRARQERMGVEVQQAEEQEEAKPPPKKKASKKKESESDPQPEESSAA